MAYFLRAWLCLFLVLCLAPKAIADDCNDKRKGIQTLGFSPPHLDTAKSYLGVKEIGNNGGPEVEMFLRSVGLRRGNPWCAAFVSYCLTACSIQSPAVRSGLASKFILRSSIPASKVLQGSISIPAGSIIVWRRGETIFGHLGFTKQEWKGRSGRTIEGNTSSGLRGSQHDGDGLYARTRTIEPLNHFRITHFTLVSY